ncbi:MAG: SCO family protein, partial [Limisphaerales bacterium]
MKSSLFSVMVFATLLTLQSQADDGTNMSHACCRMGSETPSAHLTDKSLYQLDGSWTNDFGGATALASLKGRVQIITMFFAHCQYACPLLVYKMKAVAAALPASVRAKVGLALVSFDSERDTPAALHEYRKQHQLEGNWVLLHGTADDVLN